MPGEDTTVWPITLGQWELHNCELEDNPAAGVGVAITVNLDGHEHTLVMSPAVAVTLAQGIMEKAGLARATNSRGRVR